MELCTIETFHRKVRLGLGRYLAVCTAGAILLLIPRPSALAAGPQAFSIKVITSLDDPFWTNSVINRKSQRLTSRCLLSTLPTSTPITFSVWKSLKRRTPK